MNIIVMYIMSYIDITALNLLINTTNYLIEKFLSNLKMSKMVFNSCRIFL